MARAQLALCLLACVAVGAFAARIKTEGYDDDGYHNKPHQNGYDDGYHNGPHKNGYDKYEDHKSYDGYEGYDDYGPPPSQCSDPKYSCGPEQFKELKGNTCIKPNSGVCEFSTNTSTCTITPDHWCQVIPGTNFTCTYRYKHHGHLCRKSAGDCDEDDFCTGHSATCDDDKVPAGVICRHSRGICDEVDRCDGVNVTCKDNVVDKDVVCHKYDEGPCIKDSKCDGVSWYCPGKKKAATGTPCNEGGLYEEVEDDNGKVALMSAEGKYVEKKHGWSSCHRCYKGQCKHFKFEWWKKEKKPKHKDHDDDKHDDDDDKYEGYSSYEEEEYYPTKGHQANLEGEQYEPEFYCRRPKHE